MNPTRIHEQLKFQTEILEEIRDALYQLDLLLRDRLPVPEADDGTQS